MSSDYIPRLRAELLRAGATSTARRRRPRPVLRPLALAATVALLVVAVVIALPQARDDEQPARRAETVRLEYRLPEAAAPIVRARLEAVGVRPAEVTASAGRLTVLVPRESRGVVGALVAPGRFAIYDWEASVLGPDGSPAPTDPDVTGGQDAGHGAALTEAEAKSRAADAGDAVAVHAGERWFALAGPAAITNAQLANARAATDPTMNEPIVALDFTAQGANAFTQLTRALAVRGADNARGADPLQSSQHFAIVIDDRIVSVPYVNWQEVPDGIDGTGGAQILGDLTPESAQTLAAVLNTPPLPE